MSKIVNIEPLEDGSINYPILSSHSRASTATYRDSGLIKYAEIDEVRIEDGVELLEGESTNLAIYSEIFTGWSGHTDAVLEVGAIAPDGTATATKMTETTDTAHRGAYRTITVTAGINYSRSVFAKSGSGNRYLYLRHYDGVDNNGIYYNLEDGTTELAQTGMTGESTYIGNGWYEYSCEAIAGGTSERIQIAMIDVVGGGGSYIGDGTSHIYIWGGHFEEGNKSSYIPTEATTVTRSADIVTLPDESYFTHLDTTEGEFIELSSTGDVGENLNPISNFGNFVAGDAGTGFTATNEQATVVNNDATPAYIIHSFIPTIDNRYRIFGELISASVVDAGRLLFGGLSTTNIPLGSVDLIRTATTEGVLILSNEVSDIDTELVWGTFTITKTLSISTIRNVDIPHALGFAHTKPLSAEDTALLNAYPNLIYCVALGNVALPSGFNGDDIEYLNVVNFQKITEDTILEDLPKYYNKITGTWTDLASAFKTTVMCWSGITESFRNGYMFHLADATQLKYLEEMLKVPVDETLSNDYRAGRLQAKLVPKVTTKQVIINIAKQFYPLENPTLSEIEADYTLTIYFGNMTVLPLDIDIFRNTIIDILQADLDFIVELDVAMSAFTHDELSAFTHDNLVAYRYST